MIGVSNTYCKIYFNLLTFYTVMPKAGTMKTFSKEFESRLRHLKFKATFQIDSIWRQSEAINDVYSREFNQKFKTSEERLLSRIESWINVCRIENFNSNLLEDSKTSKKQKYSTLEKLKLYSLRKVNSKSAENINDSKNVPVNDNTLIKSEDKIVRRMIKEAKRRTISHSFSTMDLSVQEESRGLYKFGTSKKRKFKFLFYRKPENTPHEFVYENPVPSVATDTLIRKSGHNEQYTQSKKLRPSIFDMESIRGSMENLAMSDNENVEEDIVEIGENSSRPLQPFSQVSANFRTDSLMRRKSNKDSGDIFYNPRKQDIGSI